MNLIRKAKGNRIPKQSQRIFICYDYQSFSDLGIIVDDLLSADTSVECVVSYLESKDADYELLQNEILENRLLVVVLTSNFIQSIGLNSIPIEYTIAVDHNIPILPIAIYEGLLPDFTRLIGSVHGIARDDVDYKVKLKSQLELFLASDEMLAEIKAKAFTANIFLSYRKKDIIEARRFMQQFHDLSGLESVSIWYDNFLTAGRDFDAEIEESIVQSDTFVLLVTPNLATEGNYVQLKEYPFACHNNKEILAVESLITDQEKFASLFPKTPKPINLSNHEFLLKAFKTKLYQNKKEKFADQESSYFLGQAYLKGIGVERDIDRAIRLFESITTNGDQYSFLAANQLSEIFENGFCVIIDYAKALKWRNQTEQLAINLFGENDINTASIYNNIANLYRKLDNLINALDYYDKALSIYKKVLGEEHQLVGITYNHIGKIYIKLGKFVGSSVLWSALKIFQKNLGEVHIYTANAYMDIGINHIENSSFQFLHDLENDLSSIIGEESEHKGAEYAIENFQKALEIYLEIHGEKHYDTAKTYTYLGKAYILLKLHDQAEAYLNKANYIMLSLYEHEHLYFKDLYANYGLYYSATDDIDKALYYFEKALKIHKAYFNVDNLSMSYLYYDIANAYLKNNNLLEATKYFIIDVEYLKHIYKSDPRHVEHEKQIAQNSKMAQTVQSDKLLKIMNIRNPILRILYALLVFIKMIPRFIKSLPVIFRILRGIAKFFQGLARVSLKNKSPQEMIKSLLKVYLKSFVDLFKILMKKKFFSAIFILVQLCLFTVIFPFLLLYYTIKIIWRIFNKREPVKTDANVLDINLGEVVYSAFSFNDDMSLIQKFPKRIEEKLINIADIFYNIKDYSKALDYYLQALEMQDIQGKIGLMADNKLYHKIAITYLMLNDLDNAQLYLDKALHTITHTIKMKEQAAKLNELRKKNKKQDNNEEDYDADKVDTDIYNSLYAKIYTTIGDIFFQRKKYDPAIENYTIAIDTLANLDFDGHHDPDRYESVLDHKALSYACLQIAKAYCKKNELPNAIEYLHLGLIATLENPKDDQITMTLIVNEIVEICRNKSYEEIADANIITISYGDDDIIATINVHDKSISIDYTISSKDNDEIASTYQFLAQIYGKLTNSQQRKMNLEKALEFYHKEFQKLKKDKNVDYDVVLEILKKNLLIQIELYGKHHQDTAQTYNDIGYAYFKTNYTDTAIKYQTKSLEIRRKIFGEIHEKTATSYNNLAHKYWIAKQYEKAIELYLKALEIKQDIHGNEHNDTAFAHHQIARAYRDFENNEKALEHFETSLNIYKNNEPKNYKKLLTLYNEILPLQKKLLNADDNRIGITYHQIGLCHNALHEHDKALGNFLKALEIREKIITDCISIVRISSMVAHSYGFLKEHEKALKYHMKALDVSLRIHGENHQETATIYDCIAYVYKCQNKHDKALEYYQKEIDIFLKVDDKNKRISEIKEIIIEIKNKV